MYDLHILLSPVVTLPVIAALAILLAAQSYLAARRLNERLHKQAAKLGKMTAAMLAATTIMHKRDTERQIGRAIETAFDVMKDIGFDKLASGEVEFEGVMFGDTPFKPNTARRRPLGGLDDPFEAFSLDELKEALRPGPRFDVKPGAEPHSFDTKATGVEESGLHEDALNREGAGLGGKGPRPFHTGRMAEDFNPDFDRSPRAG